MKRPSLQKNPKLISVGTAEMKEDGSLWLNLQSDDQGISGQALKIVKPTDSDYQMHLKHIGPLKPGEFRDIPPYTK